MIGLLRFTGAIGKSAQFPYATSVAGRDGRSDSGFGAISRRANHGTCRIYLVAPGRTRLYEGSRWPCWW